MSAHRNPGPRGKSPEQSDNQPALQAHILAERVKELNCLYTISKIFDRRGLDLDSIIRRTIEVIPAAWQYTDVAGVRVRLDKKSFRTGRFRQSRWIQECPVIVQGVPVGSITVSYCQKKPEQDEGPFLKEERNLLNVIAQRLGDIIERKWSEQRLLRYQEQLRSLATELARSEERERRRIAQALHDKIGQVLALIYIKIGALAEAHSSRSLARELDHVRSLVSECISETRSLTFDLSPPILYELGLEAALEWLAERIQQQYGVNVEMRCGGKELALDNEWRAILFAAIRELLVNVGKHAKARAARVTLRKSNGKIVVTVEDKGIGMDPIHRTGEKAAEGFGIFSIRERFRFMGGRVELASRRGKGTSVTLIAPLKGRAKPEKRG